MHVLFTTGFLASGSTMTVVEASEQGKRVTLHQTMYSTLILDDIIEFADHRPVGTSTATPSSSSSSHKGDGKTETGECDRREGREPQAVAEAAAGGSGGRDPEHESGNQRNTKDSGAAERNVNLKH